MELIQDWKAYQRVFSPGKRSGVLSASGASAPITLILDSAKSDEDRRVVAAFAEGLDLTAWVGQTIAQVKPHAHHREIRWLDRSEVDRAVQGALSLPHYFAQTDSIQSQLSPLKSWGDAKKTSVVNPRQNFLVDALRGWWSRVLPRRCGIYLQLTSGQTREDGYLLVMNQGRVDGFFSPDLSVLSAERRRQTETVVKHLEDRFLVPIQGLIVEKEDWELWCRSPNPWSLAAAALRKNQARLAPFRWRIMFLMATRAFLGL